MISFEEFVRNREINPKILMEYIRQVSADFIRDCKLSEGAIYDFIRNDIKLSSLTNKENKECPSEMSLALLDYYDQVANSPMLFQDDIHTDIIDAFRWINPRMSIRNAIKNSESSKRIAIDSYRHLKQLLTLSNEHDIDTDESEEIDINHGDPFYIIQKDIESIEETTHQGKTYSPAVFKTLYTEVYNDILSEKLKALEGNSNGEYIFATLRSYMRFFQNVKSEKEYDELLGHIIDVIHQVYPDVTVKEFCKVANVLFDFITETCAFSGEKINVEYPWKHKIYTIYNSIYDTDAVVKEVGEDFDFEREIEGALIEIEIDDGTPIEERLGYSNNIANEASRTEVNQDDEKAKQKAINKSVRDSETESRIQKATDNFNTVKNVINVQYHKFRRNEKKISGQLDKILVGLKNLLLDTDPKNVRDEVITGKSMTPIRILKRVLFGYTLFCTNKVVALISIVGSYYSRKSIKAAERRKVIVELEQEIKMCDEKIEDAKYDNGPNAREAKYAIMRTRNGLVAALDQVRRSYKTAPDKHIQRARMALSESEV